MADFCCHVELKNWNAFLCNGKPLSSTEANYVSVLVSPKIPEFLTINYFPFDLYCNAMHLMCILRKDAIEYIARVGFKYKLFDLDGFVQDVPPVSVRSGRKIKFSSHFDKFFTLEGLLLQHLPCCATNFPRIEQLCGRKLTATSFLRIRRWNGFLKILMRSLVLEKKSTESCLLWKHLGCNGNTMNGTCRCTRPIMESFGHLAQMIFWNWFTTGALLSQ